MKRQTVLSPFRYRQAYFLGLLTMCSLLITRAELDPEGSGNFRSQQSNKELGMEPTLSSTAQADVSSAQATRPQDGSREAPYASLTDRPSRKRASEALYKNSRRRKPVRKGRKGQPCRLQWRLLHFSSNKAECKSKPLRVPVCAGGCLSISSPVFTSEKSYFAKRSKCCAPNAFVPVRKQFSLECERPDGRPGVHRTDLVVFVPKSCHCGIGTFQYNSFIPMMRSPPLTLAESTTAPFRTASNDTAQTSRAS